MVDVSLKPDTVREAARPHHPHASARRRCGRSAGARSSRAMSSASRGWPGSWRAKRTAELIPLCHPLRAHGHRRAVHLDRARSAVHIETAVRTVDKTGVEMEALTAAAGAALDDLRHGQGDRPRDAAHEPLPRREVRGPKRPLGAASEDGAHPLGRLQALRLRAGAPAPHGAARAHLRPRWRPTGSRGLPGHGGPAARARAGRGGPGVPRRRVSRRAAGGRRRRAWCPTPTGTAWAPATTRSGRGSTRRPSSPCGGSILAAELVARGERRRARSPSPAASTTRCRPAPRASAT